MKILAVDTSSNTCSVAVVQDKQLVAEIIFAGTETHSRHLMEMIHSAIRMAGTSISELDGFAVSQGPGSFTGLRIGISTVKGLAMASEKPIAGISNMDALAYQFPYWHDLICVLIDARKQEVFRACYRFDGNILKKVSNEENLSPDQAVSDIKETCLFVGNGVSLYRQTIDAQAGKFARYVPPVFDTVRASMIALLSEDQFETGTTDDISRFAPLYIRKSDAELKLTG